MGGQHGAAERRWHGSWPHLFLGPVMPERLQKVLAAAGVASRRDAENLIVSGKVTVNGEVVTEPGHKIDPERDTVAVDGRNIPRDVPHVYVALYKPKGFVTTREDPHATHTVMSYPGAAGGPPGPRQPVGGGAASRGAAGHAIRGHPRSSLTTARSPTR